MGPSMHQLGGSGSPSKRHPPIDITTPSKAGPSSTQRPPLLAGTPTSLKRSPPKQHAHAYTNGGPAPKSSMELWSQAVILPASESISPDDSPSPVSEYTEKRIAGDDAYGLGGSGVGAAAAAGAGMGGVLGVRLGQRQVGVGVDHESWELRTQTVDHVQSEDGQSGLAHLQEEHQRQIAHYRNLLVRAQSASAASIHDLHTKLRVSEERYDKLSKEHAQCISSSSITTSRRGVDLGYSTEELGRAMRIMNREQRLQVLQDVLEQTHPSDVQAQIAVLERYKRSRYDVLRHLPDELAVRVMAFMSVKDVLSLRMTSRAHDRLTRLAPPWRALCLATDDPRGYISTLDTDGLSGDGWETMYRRLHRRRAHWREGSVQSVHLLPGHTNYVTSLALRGDALVSGSYDETIRIWHVPYLTQPTPTAPSCQTVISAKALSCLDYRAEERVLAAGYHDTGRVQVWRQTAGEWASVHVLNGHLHGIKAVAIGDEYLVSAGADKAIVVWDWRSGDKVVRFGQQTNVCMGIHLIHDLVIAMTVDGVIRAFSITQREMVAQYRLSDLARGGQAQGQGEQMVAWFQIVGGDLTVGTKDGFHRLRWPLAASAIPVRESKEHLDANVQSPVTNMVSPVRQHGGSASVAHFKSPLTSTTPTRARPSLRPRASDLSSPSKAPLARRTPARALTGPAAPSEGTSASPSNRMRVTRKPSLPVLGATHTPKKPSPRPSAAVSGKMRVVYMPDVSRPPEVLPFVPVRDVEKGCVDGQGRIVGATRFAARVGAEREVYVCDSAADGPPVRLGGAWRDRGAAGDLQVPEKNPMSLVVDAEKIVYGCADGTIVIAAFT